MRQRKLVCLLLIACLLAGLALSVHAAEYTYTVRLFAGNKGTIGGQELVVYEGLHYGDRVSFRMEDVQLEAGSKYYVRGFRESGRDNDTVDVPSFVVTGDRDYVVAYGVRGNLVAYTVRYLDKNGNPLLPDDTFYGNVGDKPVTAFRYIDGYRPRYYNVTKTLSENAADNVLLFYYDKIITQPNQPGKTEAARSAEPENPGSAIPPAAAPAETTVQAAAPQETTAQAAAPDAGTTTEPSETAEPAATTGTMEATAPSAEPAQLGEPGPAAPELSREDAEPLELLDMDAPQTQTDAAAPDRDAQLLPVWAWVALALVILALLILLFRLRRRKKDGSA